MARITQEDVFKAAESILKRRERPTIERVRTQLGRGSPNTITPMLDAWWLQLGERIAPNTSGADGLAQVWIAAKEVAYQHVRVELGSVNEEAARRLKEDQARLALDRTALEDERGAIARTLEMLNAELVKVRDDNQSLTRRNAQLEVELAGARGQADEARQRAAQADGERERSSAEFRTELERVREQWQGNERHWLAEIEQLREDAKRFRGEHDRSQKALLGRIEDLEQQLGAGIKERASLKASLRATESELGKVRESLRFAEGALETSRNSRDAPPGDEGNARKRRSSGQP